MKRTLKPIQKRPNLRLLKEVVLALLALLSVYFVYYEFAFSPDAATTQLIGLFDMIVSVVFLADFTVSLAKAQHKLAYLRSHWYLLLAGVPIANNWADLLRALRLLELVRLVRAGEHLSFILQSAATKR